MQSLQADAVDQGRHSRRIQVIVALIFLAAVSAVGSVANSTSGVMEQCVHRRARAICNAEMSVPFSGQLPGASRPAIKIFKTYSSKPATVDPDQTVSRVRKSGDQS